MKKKNSIGNIIDTEDSKAIIQNDKGLVIVNMNKNLIDEAIYSGEDDEQLQIHFDVYHEKYRQWNVYQDIDVHIMCIEEIYPDAHCFQSPHNNNYVIFSEKNINKAKLLSESSTTSKNNTKELAWESAYNNIFSKKEDLSKTEEKSNKLKM